MASSARQQGQRVGPAGPAVNSAWLARGTSARAALPATDPLFAGGRVGASGTRVARFARGAVRVGVVVIDVRFSGMVRAPAPTLVTRSAAGIIRAG